MTIQFLARKGLVILFALTMMLSASLSLARAAVTIQVTTTADTISVDGACSLREAITATNTNTTSNECVHDGSSGADTITFAIPSTDGGCSAPDVCTITLGTELPSISDIVTINGSGQLITVSGNNATPVIENGSTFNLENLTIVNASGSFGAIRNSGTLNVSNSTFANNQASSTGGAINNGGELNITNSTFADNSSSGGGAIVNSSVVNITNSTFFGNTASISGSDIDNRSGGTVNLTNSTVSGGTGGGFRNEGTMTLRNSIIANNTRMNCLNAGTLTADSHNLDTDGSCDNATTKTSGEIALAAALADNGGSTQTLAIGTNSAALDAGDDSVCAAAVGSPTFGAGGLDQRGITRPQGTHCDIGAFERVIAYVTVIKHVDNSSGGSAVASAWTMNVSGVNPSQTGFPGAEAPGVQVILDPGAYSVTESDGPTDYQNSFSADCSGTLAAGDAKTCTATATSICSVTKPAKPSLKSPAKDANIGTLPFKLKWNAANCATSYNVTVKDTATNKKADGKKGLTKTQYKVKTLAQAKTYKWFVSACNAIGCTKSKARTFTAQ